MAKRILFIQHYDTELEDTAWSYLGALGYERIAVQPFKGETLPALDDFAGIVVYGGSQNVSEFDKFPFLADEAALIKRAIEQNIPTLGICLGGQLICHALGGEVSRRNPVECEFGLYPLTAAAASENWIPSPFYVAQAHYEEFSIPQGAVRLASSERFPNQAFRFGENTFALQFHPETTEEIFKDWQVADWAMYEVNGAQTKSEQDSLIEQHCAAQLHWFKQLLQTLFSSDND